ncbi:MAG: tRNA uridine(34) hydroxylase [Microbacteriaceae bacterium]
MAVPKILLYYAFAPLADPEAIRLWQRDLCESLALRGRILISTHGINGTVGGDLDAVKRYLRITRQYPGFAGLRPPTAHVQWSEGTGFVEVAPKKLPEATRKSGWLAHTPSGAALLSADFPRLSVRVREEIVSFGAPEELRVDDDGVIGGGQRLSPAQLHDLVQTRGEEVVFLDGRNAVEAAIGHFAGAVVPAVANTREFVAELDSGKFDHLKTRPVVTYCTGGIRCEVLSSLMRDRGFEEVYQLDGGIARYGEEYGDDGLWQGALYVFDERESTQFSDHAAVLGRCVVCQAPTQQLANCTDPSCRARLVACSAHAPAVRCPTHAAVRCPTHAAVPR